MNKELTRIFQISDIHLYAKPEGELLRLKTLESFQAVLELVKHFYEKQSPDLILLTGDLSQDATPESYRLLISQIKNIHCPIGWIPGNHDEPLIMKETLVDRPLYSEKHFMINEWQLILLNTHLSGKVAGWIAKEEFEFLAQTLEVYKQHAMIVLHHHPLPIGSGWLDQLGLLNAEEFWQIIDKFPQVKAVLGGHVHQANEQMRKNILFMTSPSTSVQFKPNVDDFALDEIMPGFRIIHLHNNGEIETEVHRVEYDPRLLPDLKSKGY